MYNWKSFLLALATTVLLFAIVFFNNLVHAQTPPMCGEAMEMIEKLEAQFGEVVVHASVHSSGKLLLYTVNPDTRTWTQLLQTDPGRLCINMVGTNWMNVSALRGQEA